MSEKGLLIVISGPSGVGKGTVIKELLSRNEGFRFSVSATTRHPRKGEQNGLNYRFVSKEQFEIMIKKQELLEYAVYSGNYYGTLSSEVDTLLDEGYHVLLDIEVQGALQVKKHRPDALMLFIMPPSMDILEDRLRERNTETPENIKCRMDAASYELTLKDKYDYIIENNLLDDAVAFLENVIIDRKSVV